MVLQQIVEGSTFEVEEPQWLIAVILEHGSIGTDFVFGSFFTVDVRHYLAKENKQPWSQRT